jgi:molecular chaperone DnaK (HSP70)
MPYVVGIDLGHTRITAAVCRRTQGAWGDADVVSLGEGTRWATSALHVSRDGSALVGASARHRALAEPDGFASGLLARVGDDVPMLVQHLPYRAEVLAATLAGWVVDEVAEAEGGPAERIVLTHPAGWGAHRRGVLHAALDEAGMPGVLLLPSPVAAAESRDQFSAGSVLAVCRLGGEHVESAVLRRGPAGFDLLASSGNAAPQVGSRIDDLMLEHVVERAGAAMPVRDEPGARMAIGRLRAACVEAKERLSLSPEVTVPVGLPDSTSAEVRLTRSDFEHLVRPVLVAALEQLRQIASPVPADGLAAVVLVGGSARIPLVTDLAHAIFSCPVLVDPDPGTAVCRGAALAARPRMAPVEPSRPQNEEPAALALRDHEHYFADGDVGFEDDELDEPPPRPPVEITPLEPPKRFAMPGRRANRNEDS